MSIATLRIQVSFLLTINRDVATMTMIRELNLWW